MVALSGQSYERSKYISNYNVIAVTGGKFHIERLYIEA